MKSYIKNKDFIPDEFVVKVENINLKKQRKILIILLCLNLILLPLNINTINKDSNKYVEKINIESYSEKRGFGLKNIYKVAEVLLSDDIKEYNITSDGGSIVVRSIRDADNISNKKVFEVEQVELKNDGNFELKVNCYEDDMY